MDRFPLPYVVKPVDDTGSNLVRLCATSSEVLAHLEQVLGLHINVRGQETTRTALLEEFLDAPEYSVEMFTWQGKTTCLGIIEKQVTGFPYFVEQSHIFPARLSSAASTEIRTVVEHTLKTAGITHGATHTEIKLTANGCAIIEVNARLAGGMIPELIRLASGINVLEQQIQATLGHVHAFYPTPTHCAGIQFFMAPVAGKLAFIQGIEAIRESPGVVQVELTTRAGRLVSPPHSSYDRLGYVIVQGSTNEDVRNLLRQTVALLDLQIRELDDADKTVLV